MYHILSPRSFEGYHWVIIQTLPIHIKCIKIKLAVNQPIKDNILPLTVISIYEQSACATCINKLAAKICFRCASEEVLKLSNMCLLLVRNLTTFQNKPPPFWICFWQRSSSHLCCRHAARQRCPHCLPRRPPWGPWSPLLDVHAWALGSAQWRFEPASTWGWATPWWPRVTGAGNKSPQWEATAGTASRDFNGGSRRPKLLHSSTVLQHFADAVGSRRQLVVGSKAALGRTAHVRFHLLPDGLEGVFTGSGTTTVGRLEERFGDSGGQGPLSLPPVAGFSFENWNLSFGSTCLILCGYYLKIKGKVLR